MGIPGPQRFVNQVGCALYLLSLPFSHLCLSFCLFLSLSLSVSFSLFLSLSLSPFLSIFLSHTHPPTPSTPTPVRWSFSAETHTCLSPSPPVWYLRDIPLGHLLSLLTEYEPYPCPRHLFLSCQVYDHSDFLVSNEKLVILCWLRYARCVVPHREGESPILGRKLPLLRDFTGFRFCFLSCS